MSLPHNPYGQGGAPRPAASKSSVVVVAVVAIIALVAAVAGLVLTLTKKTEPAQVAQAPATVTATVTARGAASSAAAAQATPTADLAAETQVTGVIVGGGGQALKALPNASAIRLDVFVDYMCPYCGQFETTYGEKLLGYVKSGKLNLVVHNLSILDRLSSGTQYSTRAAAAALTVAQEDPAHYYAFHMALFDNQPEENSTGMTDEQIGTLAKGAGVSSTVVKEISAGNLTQAQSAVEQLTTGAEDAGLTGTPTILETKNGATTSVSDMSTLLSELG
ncbi:MAG: thioredoxin domain-containing protein [Bifidobacteriaceae bacterium]|jgi:protein-disulfide isomerase|nr:thioredoxin domain-containing protein [Bifidobacteriaceae bacterium]